MRSIVSTTIEKNELLLKSISRKIWENPELCFEERFAHDLLTSTLEEFGFKVQKHYILDTAFRAEFESKTKGPTVAVICEYDALPNIGHACGHNLIAEVGIATGIAIKAYLETCADACGKIVVLGTPAEEGGGGKIKLIEEGAFKNIDVALMAHPQVVNRLYPLILGAEHLIVTYEMKNDIDPWEHLNAVDAAVTCYNNVAVLRSSLNSRWRISGILNCKSWKESELNFTYRASTVKELKLIRNKLEKCITTASEITGCTYKIRKKCTASEYKGMIANRAIAETFSKFAEEKGIVFRDDDIRICESAVSTDMGNVSHVVPSIQPEYSIEAGPHVNHTPGFSKAAATNRAHEVSLLIAESLALTAIELMSNSKLLQEVQLEFQTNPQIELITPFRFSGE